MAQTSYQTKHNDSPHPTTSTKVDSRPDRPRIVQNFLLIWLDHNIASSNEDSQHKLQKLRSVVNDIHLFTDPDDCIAFLAEMQTEKAFIIVSGFMGEKIVPTLHPMKQVDAIYIFYEDQSRHKEWARTWPKIKGVHKTIDQICEDLPLAVQQCNRDSVAVSFAAVHEESTSAAHLNELEPLFMYTQLLKNELLDLKHDQKSVQDLVRYCQDKYAGNTAELALIREFGEEYRPERAIWWYTRECFI